MSINWSNAITVLRDGKRIALRPVAGLTRPDLVTLLVGGEFAKVRQESARLQGDAGQTALSVLNLVSARAHGLSFDAMTRQVTGVAGITGSGREEILGSIFGGAIHDEGLVTVDGVVLRPHHPRSAIKAGVAFVPADRRPQTAKRYGESWLFSQGKLDFAQSEAVLASRVAQSQT